MSGFMITVDVLSLGLRRVSLPQTLPPDPTMDGLSYMYPTTHPRTGVGGYRLPVAKWIGSNPKVFLPRYGA